MLPNQVLEIDGKLSSNQIVNNYLKGRFQLRVQDNGNVALLPITLDLDLDFAYQPYFHSNTADNVNWMDFGYQVGA